MFYIRNLKSSMHLIEKLNPPESPKPTRNSRSSKRRDSYEKAVTMSRIESKQNLDNDDIKEKDTADAKENKMVQNNIWVVPTSTWNCMRCAVGKAKFFGGVFFCQNPQ